MNIDPVYLVAPKPKPRQLPFRSAIAAMSLAALAFGVAGYYIGQSAAAVPLAAPAAGLSSAEGSDVRWALDKANGPIDELIEHHALFLIVAWARAGEHPELWDGVGRLASAVIDPEGPLSQDRRKQIAGTLVRAAALYDHPPEIERVVPRLQELLR